MELECPRCKKAVTVDPSDSHGRVVVKKVPSLLQCTCGTHIMPKE